MYSPSQFEETRIETLHALIRAHPLGTLITFGEAGLEANHIPAEMHIYSFGEHGFGLRLTKKPGAPVETWPDRLRDWLDERGFSKRVPL